MALPRRRIKKHDKISKRNGTEKRSSPDISKFAHLLLALTICPLRSCTSLTTNTNRPISISKAIGSNINRARCRQCENRHNRLTYFQRSTPCNTRLVDTAQEADGVENDDAPFIDLPPISFALKNKLQSLPKGSSVELAALAASDIEADANEERQRQWLRWMSSGAGSGRSSSSNIDSGGDGDNEDEKKRKRSKDDKKGKDDKPSLSPAEKKKKGMEEVKMREDTVFGGVPRGQLYSANDWWHNMITLPNSAILRDIQVPLISVTSWATFIAIAYRVWMKRNPALAGMMCIPAAPHSMMVSALGLLLVFRTNSAYQKFVEGRKIWEEILNTSRDLSRMVTLYETEIGTDKRRRIQRLIAAFPYLLRHRIRPSLLMRRVNDPDFARDPKHSLLLYRDEAKSDLDYEAAAIASDEEETGASRRKTRQLYWVDKRTLPWRLLPSGGAMEGCARAQNRPLWVCDRMSKELVTVPDTLPSFTNRERLALLTMVNKLSRTIGSCERIHQTVVPLNYARHALRSLTVWLFSLPFALVKDLGILTGPVLLVISWMLFGVYEIGTKIEDPFQGTLRLSIICDAIRRDVLGEELIRSTAFQLDEPKSEEDDFGFFENDDSEYGDVDDIRVIEKKDVWMRTMETLKKVTET